MMITTLENLNIPGPAGTLEACLHHKAAPNAPAPWTLIICHPHPLYGGTMDNKVVTTIAKAGTELGMQVLRFNYRGVGRSTGTFADAIGECEDLQAVIAFLKQKHSDLRLILCGFSFGAYIAAKITADRQDVQGLLTVAPAVLHYDFSGLAAVNCPWFLIQGDADEVVPPQSVYDWLATTKQEVVRIDFAAAGHFFHGRLVELKASVKECFALMMKSEN
ncbi:MAG: alpha/beta hydrolase [Gammaproteobacteria bacterium]|nr:alpha/beta hydrolase [Gammaproteobacteria bacterium]